MARNPPDRTGGPLAVVTAGSDQSDHSLSPSSLLFPWVSPSPLSTRTRTSYAVFGSSGVFPEFTMTVLVAPPWPCGMGVMSGMSARRYWTS